MTRNIHNRITKFLFCGFREFTHNQCILITKIVFYLLVVKKTDNLSISSQVHRHLTTKLEKMYIMSNVE